jgi:hypothetical protein
MLLHITLAICLDTDNMCFGQYLERFKTVVEVSKVIVDAKHSRRFSFSFDSGTTPWLLRPANDAGTAV